MGQTWTNWARNQSVPAVDIRHPRGTTEIATAIRQARESDQRVKVLGAGHSFTGIARPENLALVLDRHANVVALDSASGLVTVSAGMPLHRLNRILADAGLGLSNLGDIDRQTVAGALATGTHGTGARFGGLATQVRGLQLVLADGQILDCSADSEPDVFSAARIGLGALGVVSTVTLQAEPAFALRAQERARPLEATLERFDEFADNTDHFEFYWFPHTAWALTKSNTRVPMDAGLDPQPRWRKWVNDEFLANGVFAATVAAGGRVRAAIRPLNRISARALGSRTFTDESYKVFTSPRRVRFVEMEYAVPRAAVVDLVREVRRTIDAAGWRIPFPIEVRVAAADDIPLSTASGRDSGYVAVHMPPGADYEPYFHAVEQIAAGLDGRPHWGKLHYLDADALSGRYPRFTDFLALRKRLDPNGVFGNSYLDRVLGPP
ncbi:MAG TPA: D-arabinono-1,4-lactone oxidase [Mycobacteriales bacterium]|nr:D-arabinono-1,4-lactone oxidase [Mycobacteriales bacterium]